MKYLHSRWCGPWDHIWVEWSGWRGDVLCGLHLGMSHRGVVVEYPVYCLVFHIFIVSIDPSSVTYFFPLIRKLKYLRTLFSWWNWMWNLCMWLGIFNCMSNLIKIIRDLRSDKNSSLQITLPLGITVLGKKQGWAIYHTKKKNSNSIMNMAFSIFWTFLVRIHKVAVIIDNHL